MVFNFITMVQQSKSSIMSDLINKFAQKGVVQWIGLRPEKKQPLTSVKSVEVSLTKGLVGDHFAGTYSNKRQVTLIQAEHLQTVASLMGVNVIDPELTRRNIVVQGINLLALKEKQFKIGEVILETTGTCQPCSRMETNLGKGGYNAMRGHGGITAKVIQAGLIHIGDEVEVLATVIKS